MLSDSDLDLVTRERALPGLATLLDTAALTDALRGTSPTFAQATIHPTYVRYKPGTRCLVAYEARVAAGRLFVHASAYTRSRWAEKVAGREPIDNPLSSTSPILIHDRALVIQVFPEDARLPVMKRLWDPVTRLPLLRKLVPDCHALHSASIETLAYNPERRYVGLLRGEGTLAVIKLYADGIFSGARAAAGGQRLSALLRTPRCIGRSRRHRALALEWLAGERLADLLATSTSLEGHLRRVGGALAELHRQLRLAPISGPAAEPQGILTAARGIRALWPPFGDRADRLASTVADVLAGATVIQPIHGDFYAAQVIVGDGRIGIVDFDRASSGDPMSDVGNFLAHLEYGAIDGSLSPAVRDLAISAFIKGYEQSSGISAGSQVDGQVAAGLLRLGSRPFRRRNADWPDRMSAILDRVDLRLPYRRRLLPAHTAARRDQVPVPADTAGDRELGLAEEALDGDSVTHVFGTLPPWRSRRPTVSAVRVVRHKPGRRCLIEYDIEFGAGGGRNRLTVIGKMKKKGADRHTFELTRTLWRLGFNDESGIAVPEPIGLVPEWKMWLQLKVPGIPSGNLLGGPHPPMLGRRAAEVVHKIQRTNVPALRWHTTEDELRILRERLSEIASDRPSWRRRLETLVDGCSWLLESLSAAAPRAVHRDFHPGQLIIDGERVHVLDFDLYAVGDPGLDVGNFLAHLAEWSIRESGDPAGLRTCEIAMIDRFVELEPAVDRRRLEVHRLVSLARHVHISTRFPDRQAYTERILDYCEDQLALAMRPSQLE